MEKLTTLQKTPTDIEVDIKQREVRITWADGYQSQYTFDYLRKICPCAVCNEYRKDDDPLRVLSSDQATVTAELRPYQAVDIVGNYALQFFWVDGHSTGIYGFGFLRENTPPGT